MAAAPSSATHAAAASPKTRGGGGTQPFLKTTASANATHKPPFEQLRRMQKFVSRARAPRPRDGLLQSELGGFCCRWATYYHPSPLAVAVDARGSQVPVGAGAWWLAWRPALCKCGHPYR